MEKVVIAIDAALLTHENGNLNFEFVETLAREIKKLFVNKKEVTLITTGAVVAGSEKLCAKSTPEKQAVAAIGQIELLQKYREVFSGENAVTLAQILLTHHDFENLATIQNAHNTLKFLLARKILPLVSENSATAADSLRENSIDRLAARVANLVGADALILLGEAAGVSEMDSRKIVKTIDKRALKKYFAEKWKSKFAAVKIAECEVFLVNGRVKNVLTRIILKNENPGTVIR